MKCNLKNIQFGLFGSQVLTGFFTLGNKKNPKGGLLADTQGYKNDVDTGLKMIGKENY